MIPNVTRTQFFWAVVALQILMLSGIVLLKERTLANGTQVMLRTIPVDPVDIVRGNYVTLAYDISSVQTSDDVHEGDAIFVGIKRGESNVYSGTQAYARSGDVPKDDLYIQGTVASRSGQNVNIDFGEIETYYAPTEQAQSIERELTDGALALVALDEVGRPSLCSVEGSSNWQAGANSSSTGCSGAF